MKNQQNPRKSKGKSELAGPRWRGWRRRRATLAGLAAWPVARLAALEPGEPLKA